MREQLSCGFFTNVRIKSELEDEGYEVVRRFKMNMPFCLADDIIQTGDILYIELIVFIL